MKITMIGAGNVATHLGKALVKEGHEIEQVFSQNLLRAHTLREALDARSAADNLKEINKNADLYIIAVPDSAINTVAETLSDLGFGNKLIVHTSGATSMEVFNGVNSPLMRVGVFYPLQTFTKSRAISFFEEVPIVLEAKNEADLGILTALANQLSDNVYQLPSENRAKLHLAAVFVNNFANHLYSIGEELAEEAGMNLDILLPLIRETVNKLTSGSPAEMQTGPAIRRDTVTIERHLTLLEAHPDLQQIYGIMTKSIQKGV